MTDDPYEDERDRCVNDPLWAHDEIERLRSTIGFLASVIRSGESYTSVVERAVGAALAPGSPK